MTEGYSLDSVDYKFILLDNIIMNYDEHVNE